MEFDEYSDIDDKIDELFATTKDLLSAAYSHNRINEASMLQEILNNIMNAKVTLENLGWVN